MMILRIENRNFTFRRTLRCLALSGIAIIGLAPLAMAADAPALRQTASIQLRGYVPETSTVRVESALPVGSYDLRHQLRDRFVARMVEQSNAQAGYRITVASANARQGGKAALVQQTTGAVVPYRLIYDNTELNFNKGAAVIERHKRTLPTPHRSELRISTNGAGGAGALPPGEYTDTLTITISAR